MLLSETHFFSPRTINEVKAQYSYLDSDYIPNDLVGPEFNIEGFGNFGRDIFLPSEALERRYEVSDNVALVRGSHTLKVGGQFQAIDNSSNSQTFFGGRFNFGSVLPLSSIIALNPALGPAALTALNAFIRANGGALGGDANGMVSPTPRCPDKRVRRQPESSMLPAGLWRIGFDVGRAVAVYDRPWNVDRLVFNFGFVLP